MVSTTPTASASKTPRKTLPPITADRGTAGFQGWSGVLVTSRVLICPSPDAPSSQVTLSHPSKPVIVIAVEVCRGGRVRRLQRRVGQCDAPELGQVLAGVTEVGGDVLRRDRLGLMDALLEGVVSERGVPRPLNESDEGHER